jgi:hypothetical protein
MIQLREAAGTAAGIRGCKTQFAQARLQHLPAAQSLALQWHCAQQQERLLAERAGITAAADDACRVAGAQTGTGNT